MLVVVTIRIIFNQVLFYLIYFKPQFEVLINRSYFDFVEKLWVHLGQGFPAPFPNEKAFAILINSHVEIGALVKRELKVPNHRL